MFALQTESKVGRGNDVTKIGFVNIMGLGSTHIGATKEATTVSVTSECFFQSSHVFESLGQQIGNLSLEGIAFHLGFHIFLK